MKNATIQKVLDACLKDQHLSYTIEKNIIASRAIREETAGRKPRPAADQAAVPETGLVKNEQGEPLAGVTVLVKGSKRETLTNDKGEFSIQADDNEVLVFTYVGYTAKEVTVGKEHAVQVTMSVAQTDLNAVSITPLRFKTSATSLTYPPQ